MIFTRLAAMLRIRIPMKVAWAAGILALAAAARFISSSLDAGSLRSTWASIRRSPVPLAGVLAIYFLAFALRALIWSGTLPRLSLGHSLAAIHVAVAGNHLLPFRLGEALRVTSVVRRAGIKLPEALATTVTLRSADTLALAALLASLGPSLLPERAGTSLIVLVVGLSAVLGTGILWMRRIARRAPEQVRLRGWSIAVGSVGAWLLESVVIWQAARWAGLPVGMAGAVLVTAATIFSQLVAVAPGGFGTYEAAAGGMLVALGAPAGPALSAALTAHVLKTIYSLAAGIWAALWPEPGIFGNLRLPRRDTGTPSPAAGSPLPAGAPIVLFLPARNEELNVAKVIRRVPRTVLGRPLECLVIDDGSTDGTVQAARRAGAQVVSLEGRQGLGAGVRRGLAEGVARKAAVIAFCDADQEYDPSELESLAGPILEGRADYVTGSRFAGGTRRMKPHRSVGNRVLTAALSYVTRTPMTDAQSGFRALSYRTAACAVIAHDFNYAQVLTLDLLGKGFRYAEVPISYRFRAHGRSFVRLIPYLKSVCPAVYRMLNPPDTPARPGSPAAGAAQSSTTCSENRPSAADQAFSSNVPSPASAPAAAQPISRA